jgi:hypothetical protein
MDAPQPQSQSQSLLPLALRMDVEVVPSPDEDPGQEILAAVAEQVVPQSSGGGGGLAEGQGAAAPAGFAWLRAALAVQLNKARLFPSGLAYSAAPAGAGDASGGAPDQQPRAAVRLTASAAATPVSREHLAERLAGGAGAGVAWVGRAVNAGEPATLSVGFGQQQAFVPFSPAAANAAVGGGASLGAHLCYAAALLQSLGAGAKAQAAAALAGGSARAAAALNRAVTERAAGLLGDAALLDALLAVVLAVEGPLCDTLPGEHVLQLADAAPRDVAVLVHVRALTLGVARPGGAASTVTLGGFPILLRLVSEEEPPPPEGGA